MSTVQELLDYGKEQLQRSGNEYAKYERKVLLEEVISMPYLRMLLSGDQEVTADQEQQYKEWIERRCQHEPMQYILGHAHFMDYTFFVNPHVLIPRNDTEVLVETALELLKQQEDAAVLDLCCGSGCIGLSLKLYQPKISLTLSDISEEALQVAQHNMEHHSLEAQLVQGNGLEPITGRFHVLVCNPPYIESNVVDTLMPEVRDFEPRLALDGGATGLDFYETITKQTPDYLYPGGWLLYEIGYNQGKAVTELMQQAGFTEIQVKQDYAGKDRVVMGRQHS